MRRFFAFFLCFIVQCCILLFPYACDAENSENLLFNGSFENVDSEGIPQGWYRGAWFTSEGYTVYGTAEGHDGGQSISIHNLGSNDARYAQTVSVSPSSLYKLSGWIKADGIADAGWGANLSIEGLYAYTEGLFDTQDEWRYVTMYGETGEDQSEVTIYVRLGGYSGESEGMAYFDDIRLEKIDRLPSDAIAVRWYSLNSAYVDDTEEDWEESTAEASPFWPFLILLSVLYLCIAYGCFSYLKHPSNALSGTTNDKKKHTIFIFALISSAVLHYLLAYKVPGYPVDINCFLAWGNTMYQVGPVGFYKTTSFCDYPPAYLYILYLNQALITLIRSLNHGVLPVLLNENVIIKLFPSLCDLALVCVIYFYALKKDIGRLHAGILALLVALNPVILMNSAAWGQVDSVLVLLLLLVVIFAIEQKWQWVMPLYMLSVLVKPQALMLGFLGLTAIIMAWHKGEKQVHRQMLRGIIYAITVFLLCYLPFSLSLEREQPGWLIQKYLDTLSSYAYATVNTANLYYLFGFNWNPITNPASLAPAAILGMIALGYGLSSSGLLISRGRKYPFLEGILNIIFAVFFLLCGFVSLSWSFLGYAALAFCVVNVVLMYIRSGDLKQLPLLGAILFLLLYTLSIKMHERYLFPAIMLFALAYLIQRDFRIFILLCVTTVTMFVNEGIVLDNAVRLGASLGHLNQDTVILADILAVINLLMIPLALWVVCDLCLCGNPEKEAPTLHLLHSRQVSSDAHSASRFHTDPSLHWKKLDSVLIITITVCYGILGLSHLGSHKAPENPWTSTGLDESVVLDLGEKHENFSMLYFCQVSYSNFAVSVSDDGVLWSDEMAAEMDQGQCFRWKYLMPSTGGIQNPSFAGGNTYHSVEKLTGRYVRIRANQIGLRLCEVIFRETLDVEKSDGSFTQVSGERIPYTIAYRDGANADSPLFSVPQALCDEQDSLEGEPGWYNGTYFDEIYHARTAYEHLTGTSPYETTHPPLGKVMMSWAVGIFGMNPFGWRFAGALAGILMIPAIYLLTKQMTKRTCMAALSAVILSLDAMHYTQTRIATIDSFPVLFILFAYFFMLRFMQHDLGTSPLKSLLPSLALSGFFMGCAVASKWIGVYAGAGLAVLFFWTLARHLRLAKDAKHQITLCAPDDIISKEMKTRAETTMKTCILLCLWCLLFFVAVPLTIYLLSYIPYFAYQHPQTLGDFLKLVWKAQESMLSYHSQPGLGMDHPFYSPWYEWPLISRPMYYAMAYYVPAGKSYSIFCFGNPAIWWTGIAGMAAVLLCLVYRHFYAAASSHGEFHLYSSSWSQVPAFLLISFLAQFLPWVLVPRGTYIYHYFASVPFLILANTLALYWLMKKFPRIGKIATAIYLLCAIVLFILLFPYASGITAPYAWLDIGKEILHVYYALPTG